MRGDDVARVLRLFEPDGNGDLIWVVDGEDALEVHFAVNCADVFEWATGDYELLGVADLPTLGQAFSDARAADEGIGFLHAGTLWVARKRGRRPQGAWYREGIRTLWPLFDACGPVRRRTAFNPRAHPVDGEGEGE